MLVYNIQPAEVNIEITKGDSFNIAFAVALNSVAYPLTGKQLDMMVKKVGTIVKTLSSVGSSPAITIIAEQFIINTSPFTEVGTFKYDIQITDNGIIQTFQKGLIIVSEEITN